MKKLTFTLIFFTCCFLIWQCQKDLSPINEIDKNPKEVRPLSQAEQEIIEADNSFGLKLFQRVIAAEQADENVFISPLSVSMALGMTMNGAANQTYQEMKNTLEFAGLSEQEINEGYKSLIELLVNLDEKVLFEIANSIWYRNTFSVEQPFLETNQFYFNAEIRALDFGAPGSPDIINGWISEKTHQKIKKVIENIDPMTVMFLINAIYFKGDWLYQFDEDYTRDEIFYKAFNDPIQCKMMTMRSKFDYYEDETVQIIDLPYGDGLFSMTVFLPQFGQDPNAFIASLDGNRLHKYLNALSADSVTLSLPKFKVEYKITLNDILIAMGMPQAFTEGSADFSRINPNFRLFISKVLHQTFVQVDEEGTEAAAVTVVEIGYTSVGPKIIYMRVDHPFFFIIRERETNTLLFMGKLTEPGWEE